MFDQIENSFNSDWIGTVSSVFFIWLGYYGLLMEYYYHLSTPGTSLLPVLIHATSYPTWTHFRSGASCLPYFVDLLGLRWFHPFFLVFVLFSAVELAKKSNHCIICLSVYTEIFLTSMCCGSRVSRGCLILASIAWNGHNLLQWPYQDRDGPVESEV